MKTSFLAATLFMLAGCMLSPDHRMSKHENSCVAYGFEPGTPSYAQCMQQEELAWKQNYKQSMQNLQTWGYQQQQLELQRQQLYQQQRQTTPTNQGMRCVTNYYGTRAVTNCY